MDGWIGFSMGKGKKRPLHSHLSPLSQGCDAMTVCSDLRS